MYFALSLCFCGFVPSWCLGFDCAAHKFAEVRFSSLLLSVLVSFFTPRRWEKGMLSGFPVGPCQYLPLAGFPQVGCTIFALLGLRSLTSRGRQWRFSINLELFLRWDVVPY